VLGASVVQVIRLLSVDFVKPVVLASLIACPIGWYFMHNWLGGFAYRTNLGWEVFAWSAGAALLVVMLTVSYQAIKAAMANPVKSLRTE
jgi:putative ABC transport system permease protein